MSHILIGLAGLGIGILLPMIVVWLLPENRKPFLLNPELLEFWQKCIEQKESELTLLEEIRDKIGSLISH